MPQIELQPKQSELLRLITESSAPVIGVGGGRGAAKSSGADRCAIALMYENEGLTICMIMRTWVKQMVPFHLEPIRRDFPWLSAGLTSSPPAMLRIGRSRMEFKYAENYDAVEEAFRSGNYDLIFIDQAEQFTWREISEIRKAARSKGGRQAKTVLLFNMRGACIQDLRKVFYTREVANPEDYIFLKVNPWDNVEWVRAALERDGLTIADYYALTDGQRKQYAALHGPYTRQLASDDPVIAKADWEGDWDSLEGSYFANSFDLESTRIAAGKVEQLRKPWSAHWLAQDWGRAHYCATYWGFRVALPPHEALKYLGWELTKPINVTVIYREMIVSELESTDVGQNVVDATPKDEREKHKRFYLSPDAFGAKDSPNTIAMKESAVLRAYGMPVASMADNDRKGGWGLMSALFRAAKGKGWGIDKDGKRFQYDDALLISSECAELLKAIPALLRDSKDIDDVLKTDKSRAMIEQDCGDALRYLLKSMLSPRNKNQEEIDRERLAATESVHEYSLMQFKLTMERDARLKRAEERRPSHWE